MSERFIRDCADCRRLQHRIDVLADDGNSLGNRLTEREAELLELRTVTERLVEAVDQYLADQLDGTVGERQVSLGTTVAALADCRAVLRKENEDG